MEIINGEFYMSGCSTDDPDCLHTVEDARKLILKTGFLPLFENGAAGFSIEERTPSLNWWTGDPETDPWSWRIILSKDPEIVYGKFFDRKAGFISREWFPAFASFRRDGYDFDALWDDELASYRMKKIMDVFDLDERMSGRELLSPDIKETAGFGKGGEKNFEGVLTDLQMRCYLIMSDFRQRKNKKGDYYGWHIAAFETPETKWGYEHVTSQYGISPKEAFAAILKRAEEIAPGASESGLKKALELKHSRQKL